MGEAAGQRVLVYEFLSAGGPASDELLRQGVAMRDAIAADLLQHGHCAVAAATSRAAPAPPVGARPVAPGEHEDPWAFVAQQSRGHDAIWVVAPESAGALARFEQAVAGGGCTWLGCDGPAIALAASKSATLERLHARGVSTPLAGSCAAEATRWVVKPDDGAGAIDTRVHATHDAARADLAARDAPSCLEPWIEGTALSLSLLCGSMGAQLLSVNRQLIVQRADGEIAFDGVEIDALRGAEAAHDAHFTAVARDVVAALPGLRGFVGVDLVLHPTLGPVVIEVNPRVTSAYVGLSRRLQRNLATQVLEEFGLG